MLLEFKKNGTKQSTLTCTRADSTKTWTKLYNGFELHDLAHFVVEMELGFKKAFYGLLSDGFSIQDFELPREQRPEALIPANLPAEALQTEHMVNLLMINHVQHNPDFDLIQELRNILSQQNIPFPEGLTHESLKQIQTTFLNLCATWDALEEGGILRLSFKLD